MKKWYVLLAFVGLLAASCDELMMGGEENPNAPIKFADASVKNICVNHWDIDGDGELSYEEAALVENLEHWFISTSITSFDELKYFKGLRYLNSTFHECGQLQHVTLPENLERLEYGAFARCVSLKQIDIPESVETIDGGAFIGCDSLETFTGKCASEDGRCLILDDVFVAVASSGLTEYTIPSGIRVIASNAFAYSSMNSIVIPEGVEVIMSNAFQAAIGLTSITIPESMACIEEMAFNGCSNMASFVGKYASEDGRSLIVDGTLIAFAPVQMTHYDIPEGVTRIGGGVFYNLPLLSVTIPVGVTSIGGNAFGLCLGLTQVSLPGSVEEIADGAFQCCINLEQIDLGEGLKVLGNWVFNQCEKLISVTIPASVTVLGDMLFCYCTHLSRLECMPVVPPTIAGSLLFTEETPQIIVPESSIEAYMSAEVWSQYGVYITASGM